MTAINGIGGYFGWEEPDSNFNDSEKVFSTGRNSFEFILRSNNYKNIYLPFYICDVILEPIKKLGLKYDFYSLDKKLEPIFDFDQLDNETCILYNNIFGIKDQYCLTLSKFQSVIIDNTHSFYSSLEGMDQFNSWRKFFGVFDGSTVKCKRPLKMEFPTRKINDSSVYLLFRSNGQIEEGYERFKESENLHKNREIEKISLLSMKSMKVIDKETAAIKRRNNFMRLHAQLESLNELQFNLEKNQVPFVYPFLFNKGKSLSKLLISDKIFVPKFWDNHEIIVPKGGFEEYLQNNLVPLPIDQRYGNSEIDFVLTKVLEYAK